MSRNEFVLLAQNPFFFPNSPSERQLISRVGSSDF